MEYWLFVDGLADDFTSEELAELMRPYGIVLLAYVMRTRKGYPLGYGYVQMESEEDIRRAVAGTDLRVIRSTTLHTLEISAPADTIRR